MLFKKRSGTAKSGELENERQSDVFRIGKQRTIKKKPLTHLVPGPGPNLVFFNFLSKVVPCIKWS